MKDCVPDRLTWQQVLLDVSEVEVDMRTVPRLTIYNIFCYRLWDLKSMLKPLRITVGYGVVIAPIEEGVDIGQMKISV